MLRHIYKRLLTTSSVKLPPTTINVKDNSIKHQLNTEKINSTNNSTKTNNSILYTSLSDSHWQNIHWLEIDYNENKNDISNKEKHQS